MMLPQTIYALFIERLARDVSAATAVGVTAGMQAAADASPGTLEEKLDRAFGDVVARLAQESSSKFVPIAEGGEAKRLPGRPRKDGAPPGSTKPNGEAA